jgi:hypothetical protein
MRTKLWGKMWRKNRRKNSMAVSIVFPAEGDPLTVKRDESMVGDGDAMGVASQIAKDLPRAAEGWLGINHPVLAVETAQQLAKLLLIGQSGTRSRATEFLLAGKGVSNQRRTSRGRPGSTPSRAERRGSVGAPSEFGPARSLPPG